MNEVKTIHLGRQQFTIAVDAHKALRDYLEAIQKQPGVQEEVVKEVEMRMAELLLEHGVSGDKVVLAEDVAFLKEQLGEPRDFTDDTADAKDDKKDGKETEPTAPRRLYRDTQNGMLAGVASGLAAYLGIDVVLVRILFVILTFASGAGVLVYIIIWLLAPDAKTPSERLQMRGKAVTVDSLKEVVDRADIKGAGERAGQLASRGVTRVVESIAKVVLAIIGVGFLFAGIIMMLTVIITTVYMLIHGTRLDTATSIFPQGASERWIVVLGGVAILLLGFMIFMIGLAMITRKWRLPGWMVATIIGVFLAAGGIGAALLLDAYPKIQDRYDAAHHTTVRTLPVFTSVKLNGTDTEYEFVPDTTYSIKVSYFGNHSMNDLTTEVQNNVLIINTDKFLRKECIGLCLDNTRHAKIVIHAPSLEQVTLNGNDNTFHVENALKQSAITLQVENIRDNHLNMNYVQAQKAVFTSNGPKRLLLLEGIKSDAAFGSAVRMDEDGTLIDHADSFELKTPETCSDEPFIFLSDTPNEVIVNGTTIKGREALRQAQDEEARLAVNCVAVQ